METYSLIQEELGQTLSRVELEEAAVGVPSVGRADCARIAEELYGIVVNGLPAEDAVVFHGKLAQRGLSTEIVADTDIPKLPTGVFFSRIDVNDEGITFTDILGKSVTCTPDDVLLLAAGFMQHLRMKSTVEEFHIPYLDRMSGISPEGETDAVVEVKRNLVLVPEFRFECFIRCAPYRLRVSLDSRGALAWNQFILTLRKVDALNAFLKTWNRFVPSQCWNLGLLRSGDDFQYPSLRAFENEIRWRFYKMKQMALTEG